MADPMGEARKTPPRVNFDRRLKLEFHGSDISTDGGLLPYRKLDDALGLTELGGEILLETRREMVIGTRIFSPINLSVLTVVPVHAKV